MPDKIKDAFEAVKDTEIFIDENDFRNQLKSDPKAVFDLFNETEGTQGLFLDYKDFEIQLDLKKKEGGGLPFQKTTANAPQFFGEPSVPTSVETLESQSKLTPPQKGGVGKLDLSKGVPVKPLSGDMPIGQLKVEKDLQRIQQSVPKVGRETMYKNAIKSNENKARLAEEKMLQIQPLLQEVDNIQQAGGEVPQELINQYNNALPTYNALLEQRNKSIDNIEYFNNALEGNRRLAASYTDSGFKSRFLNQGLDNLGSLVMNSIAGTSRLLKQALPPHLAVQAEIARNISQREGDKLKARAEYTTALMDEKDNYLNKEIDDIYKEQGLVGATEYALKKFTESLPVTLGIMTASATGTGGAVLANTALFGGSANQRYEELKDRTDMTEEQKIANAVGYGSAELLFEGVLSSGMSAVYKQMIKTMGKEAAEKAIKKNVIDLVTNGVKKYMPLSGAVVEGVGEGATQLTQNIVDKYTDPTKKDMDVMEGVGNAAAIGFAGGGAMSAPTVLTYVNRSKNVEKNKEIEKKREAIQTELAKPISESTKEILQQTDNELMQEQNELVVEDMKDLTEKLPEEQKEEVKVLAEERRQIENALAETESEEVKTALENKTKQIGEQIDNIYDRAKEPIIGRTDVTQEGLGVATETGTQGVTREGVPSEEVDALKDVESTARALEGVDVKDIKLPSGKYIYHYSEKEGLKLDKKKGAWFTQSSSGYPLRKANSIIRMLIDSNSLKLATEKEVFSKGNGSFDKGLEVIKNEGYDGVKTKNYGQNEYLIFDLSKLKSEQQAISEAYHNAKSKPEAQRSASDNELITSVETLLKPKEYATQEIKQPKGVRTEPEGGIKGGETKTPSVSDSVQRTKESEKEREVRGEKPPTPEGSTTTLPPRIKGGSERVMVFKDGEWQERVGRETTKVSEKVKAEAQEAFANIKKDVSESIAKKIRSLKIDLSKLSEGGAQSNIAGIPIALYNTVVEAVALAVEAGVSINKAIKDAIEKYNLEQQDGFDKDEFSSSLLKESKTILVENSPVYFDNLKDFASESSFPNKIEFKKAIQNLLKSYIPKLKSKYGSSFSPSDYNDKTKKYLSDVLTKEALNAISEHPEAIGWYDEKTQSALDVISAIHPEIATDNEARGAFILPLAIMSNGNKVDFNFDLAEKQYDYFKKNGRFNPNGNFGLQQSGIKKSLMLINSLLDSGLSMSDINKFLTSKYRAGDLKVKIDGKIKNLASGELADELVYGATILGPKIGNGFYMNLWGQFDQLTMDRWFMRTWGRHTGTLLEIDNKAISEGKKRLSDAMIAIRLDPEALSKLKSVVGKISGMSSVDLAKTIEKVSMDKDSRAILSSNSKTDELRKAANSLSKSISGEKEAPANGKERKFIRDVFNDVVDRLKNQHGIDISMADLQAALWYPEKILYESFKGGKTFEEAAEGYTSDSAPDYLNAAKKLATKLGINETEINQALSRGRERAKRGIGKTDITIGTTISESDKGILGKVTEAIGEPRGLESAQKAAKTLRSLKVKSQGLQTNIAGIPIAIYNAALETIATAIEAGATIKEAIDKAIKKHKLNQQLDFNAKEFINSLENATGEKYPKVDGEYDIEEVEPTETEITQTAQKAGVTPKNLRDLYKINRELFGLDRIKSLTSAIAMDRMVGAMAKRAGVTKEQMYGRLKFEKASEEFVKGLSAKGKVLFQLVGENAQLAQDVRDNLQVARDMETAGKDAKTIRLATGWEKGKDDKWRYEIEDVDVNDFAVDELQRDFQFGAENEVSLQSLIGIDNPLIKAYPQLGNIRVVARQDLGAYATWLSSSQTIELAPNVVFGSQKNFKSTLIHEIQHAIQDIEGFAKGGNRDTVTQRYIELHNYIIEINEVQQMIQKVPIIGNQASVLWARYNKLERLINIEEYNKLGRILYDRNASKFERSELWKKGFPNIIQQTNVTTLTNHPSYKDAKKGSIVAAKKVIDDIFKEGKVDIVNDKNIIIVPVLSLEAKGVNKLPLAFASKLAEKNKNIVAPIYQTNKTYHTGSNALHRMVSRPTFEGDVKKGGKYVITDDVVTSGSTVAALKEYIEEKGGVVVSVVSIANTYQKSIGYSGQLALLPETGKKLVDKFGLKEINKLLLQYGITENYKNLTNAQAKYLASFNSIDRIREAFNETGFLQSGKDSKSAKQSRLSEVNNDKRLSDLANLSEKAKYATYLNLAGEVEARNVETRMGMTPEQRRATTLQETEDVARDEQIVLFDSKGIQMQVDAWHGSPYQFDKFATEKIGTGEGAQAFGWGLYFTDLEDIARNYAKNLAITTFKGEKIDELSFFEKLLSGLDANDASFYNLEKGTITSLNKFRQYVKDTILFLEKELDSINKENKKYQNLADKYTYQDLSVSDLKQDIDIYKHFQMVANESPDKNDMINKALPSFKAKADAARKMLLEINRNKKDRESILDSIIDYDLRRVKSSLNYYRYINDNFDKFNISRNLYKVTLHEGKAPEQYTWLGWDKPVSDLDRNKINSQFEKENLPKEVSSSYNETMRLLGYKESDFKTYRPNPISGDGESFYTDLVKYFLDKGEKVPQKEASLFLLRSGIDGIKYPVESISRGATSDTARGFNYVVFDENAVSIEEVIKFQKDAEKARGAMMISMDGQAVIYALTDPNVSTPLHEMAHVFEHYLNDAERTAVQNWAGTKAWTTQTSEAFARGFEKYLAEGKAPTPALQKIFEKFKQWLTDIYNGIKGSEIDIELNDQMREIYAKMLGAEAVTPTKAERKAIASAKIDEIANALKDILPKIEGEKLGVGQDEIIDVIAKAVKALVNTGIEIDEAIKQVKARLSEAFDGVEGIDEERIKVIVEGTKPPVGKKTRAIGERYTKKGYKLPDSIKYYQPMVTEEVENWAKDFYDQYGYEGAIAYIEDIPMDANPETRVILGKEVMKRTDELFKKATSPEEIDELKTRYYRVLNQVAPAATTAARTMNFMKSFYSANPFVHVEEVQRAFDAINQTKIANAQKMINELLKINGVVASQVANNVVNNTSVKSKVEKAKRNYESSKAEAKKLWQALSSVGIAETPWERARKNVKFDKALAKLAKDFIVYQSVKFEAFLKEVAASFGIAENDIDKDHLKSIFDGVKSKEIQKGIKGSLRDLDIKFKQLIEEHYTDVEAAKESLADKLSKEFGLAENDAKEVAELVRKEFNKLTYAEKLKQLKNSGLKKGGWWDTIIDLSNAGALSEDIVREQFAKELGIAELTPEIEAKLIELSKAIRSAPENTQERARRIIDLEDYKKKVSAKFGFKDYLIGTFLTNIFGSMGANEINMVHNIVRTKMYIASEVAGLALKGDVKQLSLMFNALANGYKNGYRNFSEVFKTGKLSYKDVGEIKARNIWELMQIVPEKDLPLYENAMRSIGYLWLTHNRFWSRMLQSFDALSGTANYEIASLFTAIDKADELGLKGSEREKFIKEQIARNPESVAKAKAKAKQDGLKEGTKAFRERVEDYIKEQRPKWLNERAKNTGQRLTLTQAPDSSTLTGYVANVFNKVISDKPFIKFIMPVTNTISNLFITQYEHTPLEAINWLTQVVKNKRKEDIPFNKAFSNAMKDPEMRRRLWATMTGTAAGVALFALAGGFDKEENCFEIFGAGSGDIELDNYKKSTGWKPYSVRFNCDGDYYSYQWMPLFAMLVGMVGDLRDYTKYGKDGLKDIQDKVAKNMFNQSYDVLNDEQKSKVYAEIISGKYNYDEIQGKQWGYVFANIATTPAKLFLNYGFMTTLKDMFEIASGKEQTAKKAVSLAARTSLASVPVVGAGWVREVKQSLDPNIYKTTSFKDEILKNIPFVEMPNKVKIDGYGRNVTFYDETSQTKVGYLLSRRFKSNARGTDLDAFWSTNGIKITPPDNTEFYNDENYQYYAIKTGEILYDLHNQMFERGDFEGRTPEDLKEIVRKTSVAVRNVVKGAIKNGADMKDREDLIKTGMKSVEIGREIAAQNVAKGQKKLEKLSEKQLKLKEELEKNKSMEEKIQYIISLRDKAGNTWSSKYRKDLNRILSSDVIDRIRQLEKSGEISPKLGIKKPESFE